MSALGPAGLTVDARASKEAAEELILGGLRTRDGVDLQILNDLGYRFKSSPFFERAQSEKLIAVDNSKLKLIPREWIREAAWCREVIDCLA